MLILFFSHSVEESADEQPTSRNCHHKAYTSPSSGAKVTLPVTNEVEPRYVIRYNAHVLPMPYHN